MPTMNSGTAIGKIVKSNTHVDYVCQVYSANEVAVVPQPIDYCFGGFVSIRLDENGGDSGGENGGAAGGQLIGVIYNTLLMNPDFGSLGPRLSSSQELEVFSPDYLSETATLVGIIAVGWIDADGNSHQGVPVLAGTVNNPVHCMGEDDLRHFHQDERRRLRLRYVPLLLSQNNALALPLLLNIVDRLALLFPDQSGQLTLMRNNLAWKNVVQPVG